MDTCWVVNSWATNSWLSNSWADVAGALESLGLGDLTTALAAWLRTVAPDVTTEVSGRLAAHYGVTPPVDATTLLSRFLAARS